MSHDDEIVFVRYGFQATDLFNALDDYRRYDLIASAQKYAGLCQDALREEYTNAEIEVSFDTEASGVLPSPIETKVLRREFLDAEDSHDIGLEFYEVLDPREVELVEVLCDKIYAEYRWVVSRTWLTIAQAHKRFNIPVPIIHWMCEEGLISEAENRAGRWEFPLDAFTEMTDIVVFVGSEEIATVGPGVVNVLWSYFDDLQHTCVVGLPEIQVHLVASHNFGIPLFSSDNSSLLISKHAAKIALVFEHFVAETPWTGMQWSYDAYARALVHQAGQYELLESEWQEGEYEGKAFVEGIRFRFTYDILHPCTLCELVEQSIGVLASLIRETEIRLSGGPVWRKEYEDDETFFCTEVLAPLLRKMGFESVRYTHGSKEYGKDFTFSEQTKFGDWRYYGLQAKAGNVSGGVNSGIDEILGQIRDAFAMPYRELGSRTNSYISDFIVAISGHFTENAQEKICEKMPQDVRGSVHFWDKQKILGLIDKYWADG